jgi:hypothetical protein
VFLFSCVHYARYHIQYNVSLQIISQYIQWSLFNNQLKLSFIDSDACFTYNDYFFGRILFNNLTDKVTSLTCVMKIYWTWKWRRSQRITQANSYAFVKWLDSLMNLSVVCWVTIVWYLASDSYFVGHIPTLFLTRRAINHSFRSYRRSAAWLIRPLLRV